MGTTCFAHHTSEKMAIHNKHSSKSWNLNSPMKYTAQFHPFGTSGTNKLVASDTAVEAAQRNKETHEK